VDLVAPLLPRVEAGGQGVGIVLKLDWNHVKVLKIKKKQNNIFFLIATLGECQLW